MFRIQGLSAEGIQRVAVEQGGEFLVVDFLHLAQFVRGAESVEEMQKRHSRMHGAKMGHGGEVHDFLHAGRGEHGKAVWGGSS